MRSDSSSSTENSTTNLLLSRILITLMNNNPKMEQIEALSKCGVENSDIANLLNITTGNVTQQIYLAKNSKKKMKSPKKRK